MWRRLLIPLLMWTTAALAEGPVMLLYDATVAPVRFGATEIRNALESQTVVEAGLAAVPRAGSGLSIAIATGTGSTALARQWSLKPCEKSLPQAYCVRVARQGGAMRYAVLAPGAEGAMYGALDIAEAIRTRTLDALRDVAYEPYIERRGIKFNIPLDVRTPSYSDNSDSVQQNIPEMWSMDFWREYLDEMARHRYNVLTLWSLHPFPSLVRVPEYPEVALEDVQRTRVKLDHTFSHTGDDMVRPEMLRDVEVVRRMTMAEKIQFWRDVMEYARDRGVEVYLFTWNIFTFGAAGKHGITQAQDNPVTIDYFRKSVRETVLTYPLLAGMGITAGEQMENRKDEYSKERWLWKTYGEGIRDALALQPGRPFRLIHRYHQTGQSEILEEFKNYPGQFDLSFKYAIAHMYSAVRPPFIDTALPHLNSKLRTWLTVRNDDIYSFRWGNPEYARAFIKAMPGPDKVAGFYMGPDGYNWGREFLSWEGEKPRELVMKKQWYSFLLWGRLSYDPELPESRLHSILAARYPGAPVEKLARTWSSVSNVFPEITRFFWGDIDLRWYPEASLSHPRHRGFYTVRHFMEGNTMPGSGNLDILTWREKVAGGVQGSAMEGKSPLEVAAALESYSSGSLGAIEELRSNQGTNTELRKTLMDMEAMAHLGMYYAEKVRGASNLALFDKTGNPEQRQAALRHLEAALAAWKKYAAVYGAQYRPQLLNRVGFVDIPALTVRVAEDIEIAKGWKPGTLDAEKRRRPGADVPFRP